MYVTSGIVGTRCRSWKIAGSFPDSVFRNFHWHSFSCTMALNT